MSDYDQRWIRRTEDGFRTASLRHPICDACGNAPRCTLPVPQDGQCRVFMPVLAFRSRDGLDAALFNTFRRGLGVYRRLRAADAVRVYALDIGEFVGEGQVTETHSGTLGPLLELHASFNHLMLAQGERDHAETRLLAELIRLYGKNYATFTTQFSVVYVEPK